MRGGGGSRGGGLNGRGGRGRMGGAEQGCCYIAAIYNMHACLNVGSLFKEVNKDGGYYFIQ